MRCGFLDLLRVVGIADDALTQLRGRVVRKSFNWSKARVDEHPFQRSVATFKYRFDTSEAAFFCPLRGRNQSTRERRRDSRLYVCGLSAVRDAMTRMVAGVTGVRVFGDSTRTTGASLSPFGCW
jgi:hypothetical protein